MRFKKLGTSLFLSVITLLIPLSSVFADSAGWQILTTQTVKYNSTLDRYITGVDSAHASGNVLICNRGTKKANIYVKEYDPGTNADEHVTAAVLYPTTGTNSSVCLAYNISGFQDGDNNQAEIYVSAYESGHKFSIYD